MDEENPISPDVPESEKEDGTNEAPEIEPPIVEQLPELQPPLVELPPKEDSLLDLVPENPQLYSTNYTTKDYVITLVHDLTLGDVLIATLLSVLIVVVVLNAVLGGGRRW